MRPYGRIFSTCILFKPVLGLRESAWKGSALSFYVCEHGVPRWEERNIKRRTMNHAQLCVKSIPHPAIMKVVVMAALVLLPAQSMAMDKSGDQSEKEIRVQNRRYLGSKTKLVTEIRNIVKCYCKDAKVFADVFAGTGVVAATFPEMKLITNDILYSNYICHLAWFSHEAYSPEKVMELIKMYNATCPQGENYMSINFSDTYFSAANCRKIGYVREDIERRFNEGEINQKEHALLVASLLYAMDKIANTVGHYDAYRKGGVTNNPLVMRLPIPPENLNAGNECFNEDANTLVRKIKCDVLFLDPPYNSRQYSDAYHLLENVAKWEKPVVKGVAKKMDRHGLKSEYCTKQAEKAFADLVTSADAKYIILTYNNMENKGNERSNARLSDDAILKALKKKGRTSVFSVSHKAFSTGKSERSDNEERIFLCECGDNHLIASPLNYIGGKFRILPQLLDVFPNEIDNFIDLFCGGCNVGINVRAKAIHLLDSNPQLIDLLTTMKTMPSEDFISRIDALIAEFGLSNSERYGYEHYGCESSTGLGNFNKAGYVKLRKYYANADCDDLQRSLLLYTLIVYAFNNQIRFNRKGEFNLPVGKRDFNSKMKRKVRDFSEALKSRNVFLRCKDFRELDVAAVGKKDIVYADPPYLVTCATYNESGGWTEKDERDLLSLLDRIDKNGGRFALSNVTESNGNRNTILLDWLDRNTNRYRCIPVKSDYSNSNYHRKNAGEAKEVLIINY